MGGDVVAPQRGKDSERSPTNESTCPMVGNPTPFVLPTKFSFDGVVGHSTIAKQFELHNPEVSGNHVRLAIVGPDFTAFAVDGPISFDLPPHAMKEERTVAVRFVPNRVGTLEAVLLINHEQGQQFIALRGVSIAGDGEKTGPEAGNPGVSKLPDATPANDGALREGLGHAARHVAELSERYRALVPGLDGSLVALGKNAGIAATRLNGQLLQWLRDEGIENIDKLAERGASFAVEAVLKGISLAIGKALGGIESKVIEVVADWIVDKAFDAIKNTDEDGSKLEAGFATERMNTIAKNAGVASKITAGIVHSVARTGQRLAFKMGRLDMLLENGPRSLYGHITKAIHDLDNGNAALAGQAYADAQALIESYMSEEEGLGAAMAEVQGFAASVIPRINAAFGVMLDRYIIKHHELLQEERNVAFTPLGVPRDTSKIHLRISGGITLDQEPPVQLSGLKIDGIGEAGSRIWEHIAHQKFADLPGEYDVTYTLDDAKDGKIVLERRGGDLEVREMHYNPERAQERQDGLQRIRAYLTNTEVGMGTRHET